MIEPCYYRISVKALVVNDEGKLLLARESDGTWDFLGGGLDHNEDPVVALRREIKEEAGLDVGTIQASPRYFITIERPERNTFIANVFYQTTINGLDFTPSDECEELRYLSVAEIRELKTLPNVGKFLEAYDEQHVAA